MGTGANVQWFIRRKVASDRGAVTFTLSGESYCWIGKIGSLSYLHLLFLLNVNKYDSFTNILVSIKTINLIINQWLSK